MISWTITSSCYIEYIVNVGWIMIAFVMVVLCVSGWVGQMFIVTLVCEYFSKRRLGTV